MPACTFMTVTTLRWATTIRETSHSGGSDNVDQRIKDEVSLERKGKHEKQSLLILDDYISKNMLFDNI